jgi:hypothetical protein
MSTTIGNTIGTTIGNMKSDINLKGISTDFEYKHEIRQLYAVIFVFIALIFLIRIAMNDSTVLIKNTFVYLIPIIFILFCIFMYFLFKFDISERSNSYAVLFIAFLIITIIIISVYAMQRFDIFNMFTPDLVLNIVLATIILLGLAIFYILFLSKISSRGSWTGFIINFLFYIPCLFGDAFNYILRDFATTPKSVYHLLFAELVMLVIYFYLYPRIQASTTENGVVLVGNPIMLNSQTRIDAPLYRNFFNKTNDAIQNKVTIHSPIRSTFSVSMWIFLNIQSFQQLTHKNELSLFDYSSPDSSGCNCMSHPKVAYLNDRNGSDNYIFYLAPNQDSSGSIIYKKTLPHQKWNNIIFNYRDGAIDIFINAVFETSIFLTTPIPYTNYDKITIGQNDFAGKDRSGIYGSICNVVYYRNILSQGEIISNYNISSVKTPPV